MENVFAAVFGIAMLFLIGYVNYLSVLARSESLQKTVTRKNYTNQSGENGCEKI